MIRPDEAVHLAEQALLGSLILDPQPLASVRRWLRPGDFTDPRHGTAFSLLCERDTAGEPIDPMTVAGALVGRLPGASPGVVVHDLLQAVPAAPNAGTYGRIVVEAGLRREVAGVGILLRAGALQSALSRESVPMSSTCALVDAALDSVACRWAAATGARESAQDRTPIQLRPALRNPGLRLGADKLLQNHPDRDTAIERAHEALLVGALITHPREVTAVGAHLPPQRISSPSWRTAYGAMLELAELRQPVDVVTVAAATARLCHHGQPAPTMTELQQAVDAGRHAPVREVERTVWIDQLRRIADHGAEQLMTGAANPGLHVEDLVDTGHLITRALLDGAGMLDDRREAGASPLRLVGAAATPVADREGPVAG
ncbi:DnaB-like helicase N-terminal domain-containing protein [Cellulomonas sp. C5510]|uniref:DnaB-like helicase N-terminal domain-containing protein n=1 Tax=Cellulomonas sp. C5510 TaxID=2871170 RepID=UPI001C94B596|nr:DnaB-like helicase N-terminal domain-containing protein [Cellulomonas sp. C5510]QZN84920.1 hypothetical protein K5O09_14070 [Cellulomonas sp. C5510]